MKKLVILFSIIMGLFIISFNSAIISAFTFDNIKNFDRNEELGKVSIINAFGFGSTIEEVTLKENTYTCYTSCHAIKEVTIYEDTKLIDSIKFMVDTNGKWVEKNIEDYKLYIKTGEKEVDKEDVVSVCKNTGETYKNETSIISCKEEVIGTYKAIEEIWEQYNYEVMPSGTYKIKLEGKKKPNQRVDWIITSQGIEIDDWALWGYLNTTAYWRFNTATGTNDSNGKYNLTGPYTAVTGKLSGANSFSGSSSNNITGQSAFAFGLNNFTIAFWINETGSQCGTDVCGVMSNTDAWLSAGGWAVSLDQDGHFAFESSGMHAYSTETINDGTWHRIVFSRTGTGASNFRWYLDGVNMKNQTGNFNLYFVPTKVFSIGVNIGTGRYTTMYIDDVRIYNTYGWSDADVTHDWNGGSGTEASSVSTFLNSPINYYSSSSRTVSFNATVSALDTIRNMSIWTNRTGTWARNQTTSLTGANNNTNWSITFPSDANFLWGVQACDNENFCSWSENRTLSIDSTPPAISLLYPTGTIPYGYSGQNISLNYSISDANIQSCWMNYNGTTNLTLTCNKNGSLILGTPKSIIIYANDSAGNLNTSSFSWDYNIFEYNRTFNNESISGSNQGFNITIYSKNFPSLPYLFYNNTNYLSTINNLLSNNYILSNYITLPSNVNAKNYTFYWNITDSSGVKVNTYSSNQSVLPLAIDNCSVYTFLLFNFTIKDEDTQVIINHTNYNITSNLNFNIYGPSGNSIGSFNKSYTIANPRVCLKTNSSGGGYYVDGVIDYQALSPYIHKFYYLSNYGTEQSYNIDLFDLLSTRSQEFLVTYKDINFLPAPNILIYVNRNYISENLYKTVEVVKTNNNGQALIHLVLSNIIYSFTFVDADTNSILSTLGNYVPFCNNIATGDCTINSNAVQTTINTRDYTTIGGISFTNTFNSTNRSITSTFTSVSGLSNVNQTVVLYDRFGNTTICSSSLNSPSGILTCNVPFSYGNISLLSSLYADNELVSSDVYTISKDSFDVFGYDGILWTILIIITITMLFITSPMGVIIAGLVGLIISTFLGLLNGGSIFGKGAYALIWIIISAIILIWKINKGESQ
jgi:hypothetical protein